MNAQPKRKAPCRQAIVRAVASSTAIETGQRVAEIEAVLQSGQTRFPHLCLAFRPAPAPARR
ncbi:MAG: hypothetical protein U1A22_06595 [Xanthomonadaceae bacterium]|nr:hypothetical protein [Xanthomonadaceae bacterium]